MVASSRRSNGFLVHRQGSEGSVNELILKVAGVGLFRIERVRF